MKLDSFSQYSLQFLSIVERAEVLKSLEQEPCISIRYNPFKDHLNKEGQQISWCEHGRYLAEKPQFTLDPLFHAGAYYVQEASSMFIEQFVKKLPLTDNAVVLDLCASPGGKSTHLLSLLKPSQLLVSNEVIKTRISFLKENIIKWGCENTVVTQNDSEDFAKLEDFFELVVVDAPCSGEGMFRKDPNAINEWSVENIEICYKRQRRILTEIEGSIKEGGYLIYSTCTFNKEEDEHNIQWFLDTYEYEEIKLEINFEGVLPCQYGYKFMPHKVRGEGFYVCCLRKKGEVHDREIPKSKHSHLENFKTFREVLPLFKADVTLEFYIFKDMLKAFQPKHKILVDYLARTLNIVTAGLDVGDLLKRKDLLPIHNLALSRHLNVEHFEPIELTKEDALKYYKKELNDVDCSNGLHLAMYQNIPIGFFKKINNRINNHFPQEWRIRMAIDTSPQPSPKERE